MKHPEPFEIDLNNITHVVIEIFGGDNNLSSFVIEDLQEMAAGNNGNFAVIALTDFAGEEASVKALTPGKGLRTIEFLGEINTGDPEALTEFLARALVTANGTPHIAIGFWDHGSGVFDEFDPEEIYIERRLRYIPRHLRSRSRPARHLFISPSRLAAQPRLRAMLHDDTNGGLLTNYEAHGVLKAAFSRAGILGSKIDLIFSDTCLNGMIEVLDQLKEFAQVVVASEDLEPGDGWEYQEWFSRMSDNPPMDAEEWGRQAVEAFEAGYLTRPLEHPCTLGAFRTNNNITESFKLLVSHLASHGASGMNWVKLAILDTQSFAQRDTFDIYDFAERLKTITSSNEIADACNEIQSTLDSARVHSIALGEVVKNSNGLAFWYPTTQYSYYEVSETYRKLNFNQDTGWSEYLDNYRFSLA
ncbi:hypothetical protein PS850_06153 [Pseudomonas fluorescens]|nr:hypothetical protein PS850_06153 [Pseudomonas fluorescens]